MVRMSMALMEIANFVRSNQVNSLQVGRATKENPNSRQIIQNKELIHATNNHSK